MKILFMGRKQVAANLLEWSLKKGHEVKGVLTDSHLEGSPTAKIARMNNIRIYSLEDIYKLLKNKEIEFDLAISVLYWKKIAEPLISYPKFGVINLHPAPLPAYKGCAGYNIAILNKLKKWSITAHYVNQSIDEGKIIKELEFLIDFENETALSLESKSQMHIDILYKDIVDLVSRHGLLDSKENNGGQYISRKQMEEMKEIKDDDDIDTKIRAFWFPPYLGAYICKNRKKYTLINDKILNELTSDDVTSLFANKVDKKK
jgi:methionyl-tRNA formyltransferase